MKTSNELAIVGSIPADVQTILKPNNSVMKATTFLAAHGGLTPAQVKGKKLKEIKELVGKDKSKTILATYNAAKGAFYVWSSKVNALIAADPTLRKEVRVMVGAKGGVIGFNTKARFTSDAGSNALASENASLRAELAAMRQLMLNGAAPAAPAVS
jgi:hypothetical protein